MPENNKIVNRDALPDLLKVREAAEYLRVTRIDMYKIVKEEGFPIIALSERRTRIPKEAFLSWLDNKMKVS